MNPIALYFLAAAVLAAPQDQQDQQDTQTRPDRDPHQRPPITRTWDAAEQSAAQQAASDAINFAHSVHGGAESLAMGFAGQVPSDPEEARAFASSIYAAESSFHRSIFTDGVDLHESIRSDVHDAITGSPSASGAATGAAAGSATAAAAAGASAIDSSASATTLAASLLQRPPRPLLLKLLLKLLQINL